MQLPRGLAAAGAGRGGLQVLGSNDASWDLLVPVVTNGLVQSRCSLSKLQGDVLDCSRYSIDAGREPVTCSAFDHDFLTNSTNLFVATKPYAVAAGNEGKKISGQLQA